MKKLLLLLVTVLAIGVARADEFQDRVDEALAMKDDAAAVEKLKDEAYRGNLKASLQLGLMYREGKRVKKDPAAALDWLEDAADYNWMRYRYKLGVDEAQYVLGMMLLKGEGTARDPEEAAKWLEEAAKQGNSAAQTQLANLYLNGTGVDPDPERAWIWARIATDYLSGTELKQAEDIRDAAGKRMSSEQLAKAKEYVDSWRPKSL